MYTFFTDKAELFECKISLQGAKLTDSKARLVLECNDINFIFYGNLDNEGKCTVNVPKLKNYLQETDNGKVKLEVIAEDTYFQPWQDSFDIKTSKKVQVEVKNSQISTDNNTKKVIVSEIKSNENNKKIHNISEKFYKLLHKKNITIYNLRENMHVLAKLSNVLVRKYQLNESECAELINEVAYKLIK